MSAARGPGRASEAGRARLELRVRPRARREGLKRRADGGMQIDVVAPPEDGKANAAVCGLIARTLGVARGRVTVVLGQTARAKVVEVEGMSEGEARRRLAAAMEELDSNGE